MAFGFGGMGGTWLPQPADYESYARDLQEISETSTLQMYITALTRRRELGLGNGELTWESEPGSRVLVFRRGPVRIICNIGGQPWPLPSGTEVLVSSRSEPRSTRHRAVEADECVWLLASPSNG
jgi:alpha-glucosidase